MVQVVRLRIAERMRSGDEVAASELASLTKQEVQIENLEHFERLRLLTTDKYD
jgi:hypothetical protein